MSSAKFLAAEFDAEGGDDRLIPTATTKRTPPIVFVYIILAACANLLFGYENSNVSGAKIAFAKDYDINSSSSQYGFIAAAMATGATLSCPFAGLLQDRFGRRITLIFACIFYIVSTVISSTAHGYAQMVTGRVLTGMASELQALAAECEAGHQQLCPCCSRCLFIHRPDVHFRARAARDAGTVRASRA